MTVIVNLIDSPAGSATVAQSGVWFVVGETQKGSAIAPIEVHSLSEYVAKCGARVAYGFLYDCAEAFFARGGAKMVIGRVVGPSAVSATHTFLDGASGSAIIVKANGPGDWANGAAAGLSVQVTHPTTGFALVVFLNGVQVETTPEFFLASDAVQWAANNSQYILVTDGGSAVIPAVIGATNLASGTDDRASIVTSSWQNGLALFSLDLRCGQVSAPGITTTAVQQAVLDHADGFNRTPLVDLVDSVTAATVAGTIPSLTGNGRNRAITMAPWGVMKGLTASTTRTVPYSAIQAAIIASNDGTGLVPNVGVASSDDAGIAGNILVGLSQNYSAADRATLAAAGINPVTIDSGNIEMQGNSTLASASTKPAWTQATAARTFMFVEDACRAIGKRFVRKPVKSSIAPFAAAIEAEIITPLWNDNALNNDPTTAVDPSANTQITAAAHQLLMDVAVQPAPDADTVIINVHAEAL